jgi:hypothetical protein
MIGDENYFQKVGTAKKNSKSGTERSQRFEKVELQ